MILSRGSFMRITVDPDQREFSQPTTLAWCECLSLQITHCDLLCRACHASQESLRSDGYQPTDVGGRDVCHLWLWVLVASPPTSPAPVGASGGEETTRRADGQTMMREQRSKQTIPSNPYCNKNPAKPSRHSSLQPDSSNVAQQTPRLAATSIIKPFSVFLCPDSKAHDQKWKRHPFLSCLVVRQKVDRTYSTVVVLLQAPPLFVKEGCLMERPRSRPISVLSKHHHARLQQISSRLALRLHLLLYLLLYLHVNDRSSQVVCQPSGK
jgi:hypothetical protein